MPVARLACAENASPSRRFRKSAKYVPGTHVAVLKARIKEMEKRQKQGQDGSSRDKRAL